MTKPSAQKADQVLHAYLRKATGPGARGGRILGYTRSQKPIYAGHDASHPHYRSFGAHEHREAAATHHGASRAADRRGDPAAAEHHHVVARGHAIMGSGEH